MKFSVLVITRSRVPIMTTFLALMQRSIKFKDEVEILVGYDDDDRDTIEAIDMWERLFDINVVYYEYKRSKHLNNYYNDLAKRSKGQYLCICNDDTEYMTPKWDEIVWEEAERHLEVIKAKDRVICLRGKEDTHFACFPIFGRKAFEILGHVFHPKYYNWTADKASWDNYKFIGRTFNVSIEILHNSYHSARRARDKINYDLEFKASGEADNDREILRKWVEDGV